MHQPRQVTNQLTGRIEPEFSEEQIQSVGADVFRRDSKLWEAMESHYLGYLSFDGLRDAIEAAKPRVRKRAIETLELEKKIEAESHDVVGDDADEEAS